MKRILIALTWLLASIPAFSADYEFKQAEFKREHIKMISVVAPEWEGYTNADGTGLYWDVLRAIYEPLGIKVKTNNVPWNRAMKMVSQYRTYNAIVGEYLDTEEPVIFPAHAIDTEYMVSLSKAPTAFADLSSFSDKNVGWIKDYEVIAEDKRDFTLKEFRDIDQGVEMLNAGVIDYLVDDWDEVAAAMQRHNLSQTAYNMKDLPEGTPIYVAFGDDNFSRALISIYNERIEQIMKSGELASLYQKWEVGEIPASLQQVSAQ